MANQTFIGYSTDPDERYKSTSGGVGSSIIKYLLDYGRYQCGISYIFEPLELKYKPQLIYNSKDYNCTGSIYHEINLIDFIKENAHRIKSPFVCTCLPCQSRAIRNILATNKIQAFLIELTCSSQQTYEATEYLLKRLQIKKEDVQWIKYRGNGWPSGIQIRLKNGDEEFVSNLNSLWTNIFHSKLFCMKRCLYCPPSFRPSSDIVLADPWRIDNASKASHGRTLFRTNSDWGLQVIVNMIHDKIISAEVAENDMLAYSQEGTIKTKICYSRKQYKIIRRLLGNSTYRRIVISTPFFFDFHLLLKKYFEKIIIR